VNFIYKYSKRVLVLVIMNLSLFSKENLAKKPLGTSPHVNLLGLITVPDSIGTLSEACNRGNESKESTPRPPT
jgi:hypothetical protein